MDSARPNSRSFCRVLLAHGEPPRMDYPSTLLGQPIISLHRLTHREETVSAVAQEHPNLLIIEPRLADGDALMLASDLMNSQRISMPNILRVGEEPELRDTWPFHPHLFDLSLGVAGLNQKLIMLLGLRHKRARHHVVRLNPVSLGVTVIIGHSVNLSTRGMLFASPKRINPGSEVLLEISEVPEFKDVKISGEVVRQQVVSSSMPHYAVAFSDLTPDLVKRLAQFIDDDSGGILPRPDDIF
jgi:hypothetical protein